MRIFFLTILLLISQLSFSQNIEEKIILQTDLEKAREQIMNLREDGALVVRLFLTKKKIELYRKYGEEKLANKLETKLALENSLIITGFADSTFSFCPVYFIDTKDYGRVINGEKSGYFLNKNLEKDSTIIMNEDYFFFVERSPVYDQVNLDDSYKTSVTSSAPVVSDAFVIKDLNMNQLVKPFPFYKKIFFADNLKSNTGFYLPAKDNTKGGVWYITPPLSVLEKLAWKNKKNDYVDRMSVIKTERGLSEKQILSLSKNISTYFKNEYSLKKKELTLPFNIYKLNARLLNYYYSTILGVQRAEEKVIEKEKRIEEKAKKKPLESSASNN